jgi:N-acetylneuraminic acid mutarotase
MKHNNIILRLFTALLVLVFTGLNFIALSQEHGWEQMESMNTARGTYAFCVINHKIYVFGGYTGMTSATASVEIYDIENNEWTVAKNMDQAKGSIVSGMINNKIYVIGGWARINNQWQSVNTNLEYDYETDNYVEKQSTPVNIGFGAICVYNDSIYAFGGFTDFDGNTKKSWIYDPYTDTWDTIRCMNFQHGETTAQIIDDKIYVIGGVEGTPDNWKITGKVEMYDPNSDSWEEKEEMPYPSIGISVIHNEKILVFGGDTGVFEDRKSTGSNLIQEYDPVENKWEIKHGMPFKRSAMAVKVGKYVYIIGGAENSRNFDEPVLSEVWRFNLDSLKPYDPAIDPFLPTGVEKNKIRNNLTLHQNYPNPFREYTQIKYDLQRTGEVKLQVFNFLGQEIATLLNKYQSPGSYEITWNAKDVKPGIYFVKLKAGDFAETKKVVVY